MNLRSPYRSLALALLASVALAVPAFAAAMDKATAALVKIDDDWSKTAATKDAAKVAAFYADDAMAYPPDSPVCSGRAEAQKAWASYFAEPTFTIAWKTVHAGVSKSGDLGFTAGTYEASWKGPDGKPALEVGKYLCTWKKQKDGTWKAIHDMWNTDTK